MVFDNCAISSLLYGETWGDVSCIEKQLRLIETKALKTIMKVKKGTTNDLVYYELRRGDIISKIKDRQYSFFKKILCLPNNSAIIQNIIQLCYQSNFLKYYRALNSDNYKKNIKEREERIKTSNSSMSMYYLGKEFDTECSIYTSYMHDYYRYIITRWRLSSHDLKIETGRYTTPKIPKELRLCDICNEIEDETHVIFRCPIYNAIRNKYSSLLRKNDNISKFMNPMLCDHYDTAKYLHDIENFRNKSTSILH